MITILISLFVLIVLSIVSKDIKHNPTRYGDESIEDDGFPQGVSDEDKLIINQLKK